MKKQGLGSLRKVKIVAAWVCTTNSGKEKEKGKKSERMKN